MPLSPPSRAGYEAVLAAARLAVQGAERLTDVVEDVHHHVAAHGRPVLPTVPGRTRGITGFVYRTIRRVMRGTSALLHALPGRRDPLAPGELRRDAAMRAVTNGVIGDHLAETANALAIPMVLRRDGVALTLERAALAARIPGATGRVVVLVHGLCMNDLQWTRRGADLGQALARDLGCTPVYLHYNTGLHISRNGRELAALLERLVEQWPVPVERLAIVAHSMGGMVARSACHYAAEAGLGWIGRLRKLVFLATPHHGSPLERGGSRFETALARIPYAAPFARLGRMRSAGITDLRHGNLLDEDWHGRDRFERAGDLRRIVPLPAGVECYAVAAARGRRPGGLGARVWGDGLVPLHSALGQHADAERCLAIPPERRWIAWGTSHLALLSSRDVYTRLREWLM